jgi:hypothetical protein
LALPLRADVDEPTLDTDVVDRADESAPRGDRGDALALSRADMSRLEPSLATPPAWTTATVEQLTRVSAPHTESMQRGHGAKQSEWRCRSGAAYRWHEQTPTPPVEPPLEWSPAVLQHARTSWKHNRVTVQQQFQ